MPVNEIKGFARDLLNIFALAGVVIGLPIGVYVTGLAFQIAWAMTRKKK